MRYSYADVSVCLLVSYGNFNAVLLQIVCRECESGSERFLQIGQYQAKIYRQSMAPYF